MHNDILEAKIEAAKRRHDARVNTERCPALLAMLGDRKTENMQLIVRHEENEKNLTKALEEYCVTDPVHAGRQLAKAISKQNELLAQVDLIEEIEKFMKGDWDEKVI